PIQARPRSTWVTAEEADDGPKQRSRRSLQLLRKIDPELFRSYMAAPPRHDLARMRTQKSPGTQQSPNNFLDIGNVEWVTKFEMHMHGQLRQCSFHRVTSQEDHFQPRVTLHDWRDSLFIAVGVGVR